MPDDQAPPEPVPPLETPQPPVSEALPESASTPVEQVAEPPRAASEASGSVSEAEVIEPVEIPQEEPTSSTSQQSSTQPPKQSNPLTQSTTPATAVSAPSPQAARELLVKARAKIQTGKQQKLEKIMTLFEKKTKIVNDDVEKLVHVSDATALRYLNQLVKQGKIQRLGRTGAGVEYTRI